MLGGLNFLFPGRHFVAGAAINNTDLIGSQTNRRARHIDGHIAAADNRHLAADFGLAGEIDFPQKFDALANAVGLFTRNAQLDALVGPESQIDRLVAVIQQIINGQIRTQRGAGFYFNPQIGNDFNFLIDDLPGQPMGRDADSEHSARLGQGLIDRRQDAFFGQLIGAGETRRAGADNGNFLRSGRRAFDFNIPAIKFVGRQTL